ncbi:MULTISPECIES: hypothetical protein [unclassified Haladaptatus]|uniref:hypothetical protein n=1 Tax=unclassified Haladaptatus TaxID=2622732 RepID=UPI0023E85AE0|nr:MULTISPECIES: hypothetical protein [unclassified Haladaptatus]
MDGIDEEIASADESAVQRDELVEAVTEHAGRIARELALLKGGDYGQETFETSSGDWTVKFEAGALDYLRFSGKKGDIYVVSTKQPPSPDDLRLAMEDYGAFVRAFNDHVASFEGMLDDVPTDFPEVASTATVVEERDRVVARIRETANAIAAQLHRFNGTDYGSWTARVAGKRWELKWEGDRASYLRVGGEGGTYLVSQYEPPSAPDVKRHAKGFREFVEAFNDHVDELDASLSHVEL